MSDESSRLWVVVGSTLGSYDFGRIAEESPTLRIQYSEQGPKIPQDPKWVTRFPTPEEALNYYLDHQIPFSKRLTREQVVNLFNERFSNEGKTIEGLAQSSPKSTGNPKVKYGFFAQGL